MKYDDIIDLPHHVSETRPRMSALDRAAQFSPFAALTGHNDAIDETARLTKCFAELDENVKNVINEKLQMIIENADSLPEVTVTYFRRDTRKEGGEYITVSDTVRYLDRDRRVILLSGGTEIPIDNIYDLNGSLFDRYEQND